MRDPMDLDDEDGPPSLKTFRPRASGGAAPWLYATAVVALIGGVFAGISTADFIAHLDRQVHSIHCSFIPGANPLIGESGCRTVMLSPYSSVLRGELWGGLPLSLLALAVFAYIAYRGLDFALRDDLTKSHTAFLVAATLLPVGMSVVYGYVSIVELDAVCKLCVAVYVVSGALLTLAIIAHTKAPPAGRFDAGASRYALWFAEGCAYVAVLNVAYVALSPKTDKSLAGCGALVQKEDPQGIMIPFGGRGTPSIAVLDPLCPACRGFDQRLEASGLLPKLELSVVLFPLDSRCNWMVKSSLHPGACTVSEAMLCEPTKAKAILAWAFENQERLLATAKQDERALAEEVRRAFPSVSACIGKPKIRAKLNKSLRWAVANALPVLTPQLFVGDKRVCDEDTDLGLEYTISSMLKMGGAR